MRDGVETTKTIDPADETGAGHFVGAIDIIEVAPRDGLQDEPVHLSTREKVAFITRLVEAGFTRIEVTSFVHPRAVPQMADAEAVMAALPRTDAVSYSALVLNERGLERALAAGVDEINYVVVATDTFAGHNQNTTTADGLALWNRISELARASSLTTAVTIGAAFGCPFEGEVGADRLEWILRNLTEHPPDEISLADTIGVAVPTDVVHRLGMVKQIAPTVRRRLHVHNTRNTGIAYAAVEAGVDALDASAGGIGGCPFAPSATGNIPTEDLIYMLHRMGVSTGVALESLVDTVGWLGEVLGNESPGLLSRAGIFPPARPLATLEVE